MASSEDAARATYDRVARRYAAEFADDLASKALDRALLSAFAELVRDGDADARVGDLGCGPGFEARFLTKLGLAVVGVDLSPEMIAEASRRHLQARRLEFVVGSLLALPFADGALAGAVAIYSVIHLEADERAQAYGEMARVIRAGGSLLLAIHTSAEGQPAGSRRRLETWWGHEVALDGHFIAESEAQAGLSAAGFEVTARASRGPWTAREFPSQRAYLLARRRER